MERFWNEKRDNLLRRHYPKGDLHALAKRLGVTWYAIKSRAAVLGLHRKVHVQHKPWKGTQLAYLKKHYATTSTAEIAKVVKHTTESVRNMAAKMGLKKDIEFLRECGRRNAETPNSIATRFVKGHVPSNKGKRQEEYMSAESIERCSKTRFKPGHAPHNTRDVGTERVNSDGYVYLKTEDGIVLKHRHVWESAHGPIPDGHVVIFRDGNKQNCELDNLSMISRADNARRNTASMKPESKRRRIEKATKTRNESIRRDRVRIHWGLEPVGKLVKRW